MRTLELIDRHLTMYSILYVIVTYCVIVAPGFHYKWFSFDWCPIIMMLVAAFYFILLMGVRYLNK